jgi:hypothetical protein
MKYAPIWTLSLLLLFSCAQKSDKRNQVENSVTSNEESENEFNVSAMFNWYEIKDDKPYSLEFEKESGETIHFEYGEINNFDFLVKLEESEISEYNEGWGINHELNGKWFKINYINKKEWKNIQDSIPLYVIKTAILDEEKNKKTTLINTPTSFEILEEIEGDLDNDGISEKVILYETGKEIHLGTERQICIYKKNNNTWQLWKNSASAILGSEQGGMMGDPFDGITIDRNCIVISHFGGSRSKWEYTHSYKYQKGDFRLIGVKVIAITPCEEFELFEYNLSNGEIKYEKELQDCDNGSPKIEKKKMIKKLETLPSMDGFSPGSKKITFPNSEIIVYY